jgi:hypothetical protein
MCTCKLGGRQLLSRPLVGRLGRQVVQQLVKRGLAAPGMLRLAVAALELVDKS